MDIEARVDGQIGRAGNNLRWGIVACAMTVIVGAPSLTARAGDTAPSPGSTALTERATKLEGEIAKLLEQRPSSGSAPLPDLRIDLRLIERWLLARAADAPDEEPLREIAALRADEIRAAGQGLDTRLTPQEKSLTSTQLDGLNRLHQFTYRLPELKTPAAVDEAAKTIGLSLIMGAGPSPAETQNMPLMRPAPLPSAVARNAVPTAPQASLASRIEAIKDPPPLVHAFAAMLSESRTRNDAEIHQTLTQAVDLAEQLQGGNGIDTTARSALQQQLADALSLYSDPRTRALGKNHLAELDQYRRSLAGVNQLEMPPALREKLAPALIWATHNAEHGGQVLSLIQAYNGLCARFDADANFSSPPANQKRMIEPLSHHFGAQRMAFIQAAQTLTDSLVSSPIASMESAVKQMTESLDTLQAIEQLPHAEQILASYKVRPTGALERRANLLANELASPIPAVRDQAARIAVDISKLAQLAEASSVAPKNIPPDVIKAYVHDRMPGVETRRANLIADLATQLGAGKAPDKSEFAKLQTLIDLYEALSQAAQFESAMARVEPLNRWADWSISTSTLRTLTDPYREATAAAFDGFVSDNSTPMSRWPVVRKPYSPILAFVVRDAAYSDACTKLPTGVFGDLAKLLTPMSNQPFASERYASCTINAWLYYSDAAQSQSAQAMFDGLVARLAAEQKSEK